MPLRNDSRLLSRRRCRDLKQALRCFVTAPALRHGILMVLHYFGADSAGLPEMVVPLMIFAWRLITGASGISQRCP